MIGRKLVCASFVRVAKHVTASHQQPGDGFVEYVAASRRSSVPEIIENTLLKFALGPPIVLPLCTSNLLHEQLAEENVSRKPWPALQLARCNYKGALYGANAAPGHLVACIGWGRVVFVSP